MRSLAVVGLLVTLACAPSSGGSSKVSDPMKLADPRLGSGGFAFAAGNCFPGAGAPNGLVLAGPDTVGPYGDIGFLHFDGYWDGDDTIQGFSQLHLSGTGASDFAVLSVMPLTAFDASKRTAVANASHFDKKSERASPGYYAVTLDGGVETEITATPWTAVHRFTFPQGAPGRFVLFDLTHAIGGEKVVESSAHLDANARLITGHLRTTGGMSGGFTLYFAAKASEGWTDADTWDGDDAANPATGFALRFDDESTKPVELAISLSFVSEDGASANLAQEKSLAFDDVKRATQSDWATLLKDVVVYGGSDTNQRMFYSALHHAFVMPERASDADGTFDYQGHVDKLGAPFVTSLSLWDTYRTLNPLYAFVDPARATEVATSLDAMSSLSGVFPKWPLATSDSGSMVGSSADVVLATTYLYGEKWDGAEATYERLRAAALDATPPPNGRGGRDVDFDDYARLGYVPADGGREGTVSVTLEFAEDDFALSNLAKALGHDDDAAALLARSHGYRKLYDPTTGFLRARLADGTLAPGDFDPVKWDNYVEGDAWQYLWAAPHDAAGTAQLLGGNAAAAAKLERFFELAKTDQDERTTYSEEHPDDLLTINRERPYFWAGNEPDLHAPYLFSLFGRPDLTEKWLPWVRDTFFRPTPDGLPGNDDGGTMSAWWVWSAMGLYPVAGSDELVLGAPIFPRVDVGQTLVIEAPAASDANVYVAGVTLNGKPLMSPVVHRADLHGTLHFDLTDQPTSWGR